MVLQDTPEYLLELLAKLLRALLYNMNVPEEETESAVERIKERKMARLFENVTMDIQAERRAAALAREEADKAQGELKLAQSELEIYKHIIRLMRNGHTDIQIIKSLVDKFALTEKKAQEEVKKVFEE